MEVRKGKISDIIQLKALYYSTINEVCKYDYNQKQIEVWSSNIDNNKRWEDILNNQYVLIAYNKLDMLGFATLDKNNYIDLLYTNKDYQRQGVATKLLDEIEIQAMLQGQIYITSNVSITAKSFFENREYKVIKEQKVILQDTEFINYKMSKKLIN